MLGLAE
jgi:hypothetical protein